MRSAASVQQGDSQDRPTSRVQRRTTELPAFVNPSPPAAQMTGVPFATFSSANDGVFANLNAKPEKGEKVEELPPVRLSEPHDWNPANDL